ncbi:hypothetical protein C6P45_004140 [Maudiozyma exigua]|uniref:Actin cytoskeleton-regulatory complex protein PAN1 n=1 Tax=Maudiozyma exigua TaxID=34358 RepID=A0A9P6WAU6_MAUEX|nr:hypothetical protein C6P45_004140 [Kazachstania exigua]
MSGIFFKTPLTDEELTEFTQLFNSLDTRKKSTINYIDLQNLLSKTGLQSQDIIDIWNLVDIKHTQQLNFKQFAALLRAIGNKQHFPLVKISPSLFEVPSPKIILAKEPNTTITSNPTLSPGINTLNHSRNQSLSSSGNTQMNRQSSTATSGSPQIAQDPMPPLTPNDLSRFSQLFDRTCNGPDNVLSGNDARQIFVKAKLSNKILGAIWFLCDKGTKGFLTKEEFIMAMHLIDLRLSKHESMDPLPRKLSQQTWDSIDLTSIKKAPPKPPTSAQSMTTNTNSNANGAPVPQNNRNSMISSSAPKPPPHRTPTTNTANRSVSNNKNNEDIFAPFAGATDDWNISPQLKSQFDRLFDSLNVGSKSTSLTPDILVPVLTKSSLGREDLADVWELADIDKKSSLTKNEFAIAIFLIKKLKANTALPTEIPKDLLNSLMTIQNNDVQTRSRTSTLNNNSVTIQSPPLGTPQMNRNAPSGQFQTPEMSSPRISSPRSQAPAVPPPAPTQEAIRKQSVNQLSTPNDKELLESQANVKNLEDKIDSAETQLSESYRNEVTLGQELEPLKAKEAELTEKLVAIKLNLEESNAKTTELDSQIESTKKNITSLEQELTTAEGNYHANEARLEELEQTLQESTANNEQMKAEIVNLQSMTASINSDLTLKQDQVRDIMNSVDGTSKALDLDKITTDNIQKEIDTLDEKVNLYINKKKELDNYENVVKEQHEKLEKKYKELEKHSERIKHFEQLLKEKESTYKEKLNELDSTEKLVLQDKVSDRTVNKEINSSFADKIDNISLDAGSKTAMNEAEAEEEEEEEEGEEVKDIPKVPEEPTAGELNNVHKQVSLNTNNSADEFEDSVDQIPVESKQVEYPVESPTAIVGEKTTDYVEVPSNISVEPFEDIQPNDIDEN